MEDLSKFSVDKIEKIFKKSRFKSRMLLAICLFWAACCVFIYSISSDPLLKKSMSIFSIITLGLWCLLIVTQVLVLKLTSIELGKISTEKIGKYSIDEVNEIINEIFLRAATREKPTVYINKMDAINAMVFNIYLFNFIKSANAIFITEKCFNVLDKEEIKAIIYHEMGHFNRYIYEESKKMNLGIYILLIMPFSLTVLVTGILFKILFVTSLLLLLPRLLQFIRETNYKNEHALEYLCDYFAATKAGKLPTINMLISVARQNKINDESIINKMQKEILFPVKRVLIDWKEFDVHIQNEKIEKEEYNSFISTIESTLNAQIIANSMVDHNSNSHPSLTNRVMFIHNNLKE